MENLGPSADGHNTTGQFNPAFHGFNGLLGDSLPGFSQAIDQRVLDTIGNNSNCTFTEDSNAGSELGFGKHSKLSLMPGLLRCCIIQDGNFRPFITVQGQLRPQLTSLTGLSHVRIWMFLSTLSLPTSVLRMDR